jgi:MFS family permease
MALLMQAVIVGWQIYQIKPDPLLLGLVGLAEAVPAIGCSFISGHLVDVHRPATVLKLSLIVLFLNACLLWIAVAPFFPFANDLRLSLLFLAVFISGAARSFGGPAVFSMIPKIVPRPILPAAAAWSSSVYQFASIIGPVVGGLAYGNLGPLVAFALPAAVLIAAFLSVLFLSSETRNSRNNHHREPLFISISNGLKFAFGHNVLLSTMTLDMFSVLFGGAVAVLPIYADQILHVGSQGLGLLRAAPALGSVVVAFLIALFPLRTISGKTLLLAVAGFGVATFFFAISTNFVLSFIFLAASGACDGLSMVIRSTILQLLTPDHMSGRVSSVSTVFITSSNEIGAFESGVAARAMGLVPSVIFGGIMTLVVVIATAFVSPGLRKTRISQDGI